MASLGLKQVVIGFAAAAIPLSMDGTVRRLIDLGAFRMLPVAIGTAGRREPAEGDTRRIAPSAATLFRRDAAPLALSLAALRQPA
jgi:hypothetical protein